MTHRFKLTVPTSNPYRDGKSYRKQGVSVSSVVADSKTVTHLNLSGSRVRLLRIARSVFFSKGYDFAHAQVTKKEFT